MRCSTLALVVFTGLLAIATAGCSPAEDRLTPTRAATAGTLVPAQDAQDSAPPVSPVRTSGLPDFTSLIEKQGPAVVNVVVTRKGRPGAAQLPQLPPGDPFFEFFRRFMPDPEEGGPGFRGQGLGSGFIISPDGYILTNAHVVAEADEVTVRLADDKREFKGKVVGTDRRTDVALLKVDATDLPVATLGDSSKLQVGEWVAAIGSPFGFENTITAGIVSAKGRNFPNESFVPFIQTDVAVNPGNSGGPLLNMKGEVVGINSMIYSQTGGYMGVSFAIPIELATDVAKQLQTTGKVTRGRLGVNIQEITPELAQSFKLKDKTGVLIAGVEKGSPADKAGLQSGDIIRKYNGKELEKAAELPRLVAATKPGSVASLEVWRKGATHEVKVTVGEVPAEKVAARSPASTGEGPANRLGLVVGELSAEQRQALGVKNGVVVEAVEARAAGTPIRRGDVITAIGQTEVTSLEQFNEIVQKQEPGSSVALLVRRGESALYVPVEIGRG
ncbi:MAG TPA: DegQ family serine endoprotease [Burkholderiales bacterium]|nr:DegQ family serine endoprotease [Burkholderiales bacterium]